jgi:hypothetical protein
VGVDSAVGRGVVSHLSVEKKELLSPEAKKLTRWVHEIPCVVFLLGNLWEAEKRSDVTTANNNFSTRTRSGVGFGK